MRADRIALRIFKTIAFGAVLIWSLLPIAVIVLSSFKADRDIFAIPPKLQFMPTLANYEALWVKWGTFFSGLFNSFVVTAGATALAVALCTVAGYAYSRFSSKALTASIFFLVVIRLFPPIVLTLPLFPVINYLALNDTHVILIVIYATLYLSLGTVMMRTFIDQIPKEIDEAAKVDGASTWQLLRQVILPLAAPGMVSLSVFVVVYAWNEYLFAFIFTATRSRTAPMVLSEMMGAIDGVEWGVLFSASTLQLLPVLVFVIFSQKYLIAGLTAGATKG